MNTNLPTDRQNKTTRTLWLWKKGDQYGASVNSDTAADALQFTCADEVVEMKLANDVDFDCISKTFYRSSANCWKVVVDVFQYGVSMQHLVHFTDYQTYSNNSPTGPGRVQTCQRHDGTSFFANWRQNRYTKGVGIQGLGGDMLFWHITFAGTIEEQFESCKRQGNQTAVKIAA